MNDVEAAVQKALREELVRQGIVKEGIAEASNATMNERAAAMLGA